MAKSVAKKKNINLNLGCGIWLRKDFINIDKYYTYEQINSKTGLFKDAIIEEGAEFIQADILKLPFPDNHADYVELMNTIEHFPMKHIQEYVKEIYRVMKPGAKLVIVTNSMTGLALDWLHMVTAGGDLDLDRYYKVSETIYGNQGGDSEGELHRCPFTHEFLNYTLVQCGFTDGKLYIIPEGSRIPQLGTVPASEEKNTARNDLLVAEVIK